MKISPQIYASDVMRLRRATKRGSRERHFSEAVQLNPQDQLATTIVARIAEYENECQRGASGAT